MPLSLLSTSLMPCIGTGCIKSYTVVSGDWCDKIRSAQGVTLAQLQTLNPSLDCSNLQPGQVLCVTSGE